MQLAPITSRAAAATLTSEAPGFEGGIEFEGSGRFSSFSASATDHVYGEAGGYESLAQAVDALTMLTVGAREPAAGVFEADGRFYGRRLDNDVTFEKGATWSGFWKLEQYPADLELLDGSAKGTTTRVEALKAVVDGAQRVDVTHLPVA